MTSLDPTPLKPLPKPERPEWLRKLQARLGSAYRRIASALSGVLHHWRTSLQFRAVAATVLLTAVAFLGVGAFLSSQIANALYQERVSTFTEESRTELSRMQNLFNSFTDQDKDSTQFAVRNQLSQLERTGSDISRKFILTPINPGQDSWVYQQSSPGLAPSQIPPDLAQAVATGPDQYYEALQITSDGRNVPAIAYGTRVNVPPNAQYALYLVYDLGAMQTTLNNIHGVLWLGGSILLLAIGAIAWLVTRSVVKPVSEAAQVSERLAAGDLEQRMAVRGEDEVARLGAAFNHMAASLQEQITQLGRLSEMQQRFVSDVSHELRTPITTVGMAAEMIYDYRDSLSPDIQRSAELLHDQVGRFQLLLSDLLEVSRFDAGVAVLDPEPTDLLTLVQDVMAGSEPLATSHNALVRLHALAPTSGDEDGEDFVADVDRRRIERIVRNLVVNGLEHGDGKPLDIYLAGNDQAIAIAVRDHGVGMTQVEATRVFDRFWRADPARARTTGGSGLGLSIATEDTRLHHGWLQAWGEPGQGACFRLTLPRHRDGALTGSPLALPPDLTLSQRQLPGSEDLTAVTNKASGHVAETENEEEIS